MKQKSLYHIYIYIYIYIYIHTHTHTHRGCPPKNVYTLKIIVNIVFNYHFIVFSLPVLKLTPILIQTLLTMPSNGITHIMKQFPWYLGAVMLNGLSYFSDCCRFCSVEKTLKMKSFIFNKMGYPHITIAMLSPSLMRSWQTSGLDEEVLLNILSIHQISHH